MGSEDIVGVILEVKDGDDILVANPLNSSVGQFSLFFKTDLVFGCKNLVLEKLLPLCDLFDFVAEKLMADVFGGLGVELAEHLDLGVTVDFHGTRHNFCMIFN